MDTDTGLREASPQGNIWTMDGLSNSQIDKAGAVLRQMRDRNTLPSRDDITSSLVTLRKFRASFQTPMTKANNGLRSCAKTVLGRDVRPAQRLKQPPRMIDKLHKKSTMRLCQMEDIGGVRCVLDNLDEVYDVAKRIRRLDRGKRVMYEDNANETDRPSGYRALHMIVGYDNHRIEIQLRTTRQHSWAEHVEELDDFLSTNLKDGDGPDELLVYLKTLGDTRAALDQSGIIDSALSMRFECDLAVAQRYLDERK
jgi:ppGpp synthetase/RelA/SpoT-type nucleotidyltranferase